MFESGVVIDTLPPFARVTGRADARPRYRARVSPRAQRRSEGTQLSLADDIGARKSCIPSVAFNGPRSRSFDLSMSAVPRTPLLRDTRLYVYCYAYWPRS